MYNNIGGKIKGLAKVLGWLFLIGGIIAWLIFITNGKKYDDGIGWGALVGCVLSFISTWFLYGFGQLVEDTEGIRSELAYARQPSVPITPNAPTTPHVNQPAEKMNTSNWVCACGRTHMAYTSTCECGRNKNQQ